MVQGSAARQVGAICRVEPLVVVGREREGYPGVGRFLDSSVACIMKKRGLEEIARRLRRYLVFDFQVSVGLRARLERFGFISCPFLGGF